MSLSNFLSRCLSGALAFCCLASIVQSQEPQFRVDSYIPEKFTDFQWSIDGHFYAKGFHQEVALLDTDEIPIDSTTRTADEQEIQLTSDLSYRHETIPWYFLGSVKLAYVLHNQSPSTHSHTGDGFVPGIFPSFEVGKYLFSDFYISTVGSCGWSYAHVLHDINPDTRIITYTLDGAISPGWGRVYEGRYGATALYILDELENNGLLVKSASGEDMLALTEIVHDYRLRHALDDRLHKIQALSKIMEFLENRGIIKPAGQYGYLFIQDVWDYFPGDARLFGWRVKAGIGLQYGHSFKQITDEYETSGGYYSHSYEHEEEKDHNPYYELMAEYHYPIDVRWQFDIMGSWRYYFNHFNSNETHRIKYAPNLQDDFLNWAVSRKAYYSLLISGVLEYIIDSRSRLSFTPSYTITHFNSKIVQSSFRNGSQSSIEMLWYDYLYRILQLQTNFEYRISIPTSLSVSLIISQVNREDINVNSGDYVYGHCWLDDTFSYSLTARIKHYLF